jgi:hypothetical protein
MNIDDVDAGENTIKSLEDIFAHQKELYLKYKEIEGMDWEGDTVNIHTLKGQKWLKDMLWRTTEELAESYEAYITEENNKHTIEELADALHFFVEFCILAGITPEDLCSIEGLDPELGIAGEQQSIISQYWHATYALGLIGNTLKNKPWKKHQMKTDVNKFKELTKMAFIELIDCFYIHKMKPEEIYDFYFRKNAVNQFRQRSNY